VAANEFGPLPDGNLGEILKFIPGVDIIYSGGAAVQAQLGGVGGTNTPITVNGFGQAGATRGTERVTDFTTMSSHNISRVEVLHTPTPESAGNALAGSINVVSKGAFERAKPSFDWSTYISIRDNTRDFDKVPPVTAGMKYGVVDVSDYSQWFSVIGRQLEFESHSREIVRLVAQSTVFGGSLFPRHGPEQCIARCRTVIVRITACDR
jgi:outer membrane receptor protein involved in Fe transport